MCTEDKKITAAAETENVQELSDDQIELVTGGVNDDYKPAGRF